MVLDSRAMNTILPLKLFLVPSLIYAVTLAGRRWGPSIAGWLSAFPVVSGPILLAIALEQGAPFAATAAEGTLMAVLAILAFSLAYAWVSARAGVVLSMTAALVTWAVVVAGLQALHPPLALAAMLVLLALVVAPHLFPPLPALPPAAGARRGNDLPWRMAAGAALVLSVSAGAAGMGPRLSGFFAMFPVMGTVLLGFSHVQSGRVFAVHLLRGMVLGYFAFAAFCTSLAVLLRTQPLALSFASAFVIALATQLLVKVASSVRRAS